MFNIKTHNTYKLEVNPMFPNLLRELSLYFTLRTVETPPKILKGIRTSQLPTSYNRAF